MAKLKKKSNTVLKPRRSTRNLNTPQIRESLIDLILEESIQNNEDVQQELPVDEKVDNVETGNMDEQTQQPTNFINIHDQQYNTLIETGGGISLISQDIFQQIKTKVKVKYISNNLTIRTFDHTLIPFTHAVKIPFKLNGTQFNHTFYVTTKNWSHAYQILLGLDFFKSNKIIFDSGKNKLIYNNREFSMNNFLLNNNVNNVITKQNKLKPL